VIRVDVFDERKTRGPLTIRLEEDAASTLTESQYNGENPAGALWVLALLCDMVDLSGDDKFADGTLRTLATDLVEFVRLRYPQREQGRMVIAPCNAGETWQGVRDPAEMVCALRLALPRLIAVGRNQRWDRALIAGWEELLAADAIDLTAPYFNMYVRQLPNCERAAQQRWGVSGAYFPETTAFDGPTVLPDDTAIEFQDVLLGRKPHTALSPRAKSLCQFDSRLRVVIEPHKGRFSWISHVASSGSELAIQAWWRYRYTGDRARLRTHACPLLRGTVEFYRHLVKQEADGRYHLTGTHAHEDFWGVGDSIMDLAAIRGTVPLAMPSLPVEPRGVTSSFTR